MSSGPALARLTVEFGQGDPALSGGKTVDVDGTAGAVTVRATTPTAPGGPAGGRAAMDELLDLAAEHQDLAALLGSLRLTDWDRASAAAGWTVRDQVAHLADTEEVAADTLTGGPREFARAVSGYRTAEEFTAAGCRRGDSRSVAELADWWVGASARTRELLARRDPAERVAWGFGLPVRTFAAARLMEHWAHGLDIRDALGLPAPETPRLRHVAALGLGTLRYALARARVRWPAGRTLRLDLAGADGTRYAIGPPDATDVLRGPLIAWCRTAVQRTGGRTARPPGPAPDSARSPDPAHRLEPAGELAQLAAAHGRAYL